MTKYPNGHRKMRNKLWQRNYNNYKPDDWKESYGREDIIFL